MDCDNKNPYRIRRFNPIIFLSFLLSIIEIQFAIYLCYWVNCLQWFSQHPIFSLQLFSYDDLCGRFKKKYFQKNFTAMVIVWKKWYSVAALQGLIIPLLPVIL